MNTNDQSIDEAVSAFVDGEASEIEIQRLLKLLSNSGSIDATHARQALAKHYSVKGAISGSQTLEPALITNKLSFADSVSNAIAHESFDASSEDNQKQKVFGFPFAKMAIAASVAFVFVLGAQQFYAVDSNVEALNVANTNGVQQAPVKAVVPDGYKTPNLSANTVSTNVNNGTNKPASAYYQEIQLDKAELQAKLEMLMLEVKQLKQQAAEQKTNQ